MKICTRCEVEKPLSDFNKDNRHGRGYHSSCRDCSRNALVEWRSNNKQRRRTTAQDYYRTQKGRAVKIISEAKSRATKKLLPFDIHRTLIEHLLEVGRCAKSGIAFDFTNDHKTIRNPFSPSIDRIDSSRGYVSDNIQLVCSMYNYGKSEFSEIDFIAMCIAVARKHENNSFAIARLEGLTDNPHVR